MDTQKVEGHSAGQESRYALVFPSHPSHAHWPQFWIAMVNEAERLERVGHLKMEVFYDIDQWALPNSTSYRKLLEQVRDNQIKGVIFATDPWVVQHTELVLDAKVPMVAVTHPQPEKYPAMGYVCLNTPHLFEKAVDFFAARGRKRLAVLTASDEFINSFNVIKTQTERRGMQTQESWILKVNPATPEPSRKLIRALIKKEHPDALLIADDNLLEHAAEGLAESGVHVDEDIDVIAHCNFPWPTAGVVLARRIGFDSQEVLREAVRSIDALAQGGKPGQVWIDSYFEEELGSLEVE